MGQYPKPDNYISKSIFLSGVTLNISKHVIEKCEALNHPVNKKILNQIGAIQAVADQWPVLAIPMESGDYHCVKYDNYYDDPKFRFISCSIEPEEKKKGRPKKTKLGLIGVDKATEAGDIVWLTEGFWDFLTLKEFDYPVWAVPGARNLLGDWLDKFKDKIVIICFDNDDEGIKWSEKHAKKLSLIAKKVLILNLPFTYNGEQSKDISDIRRFSKDDKSFQDYILKLVESTPPFDFPIIEKIREIVHGKGASITKAEIITQLIKEDIEKHEGLTLPYNDGQELALIIKGKEILIDSSIDRYLSNCYDFLPSLDIWKSTKGLLYNNALRNHGSIKMHSYSTYENKQLHFGLKDKGVLSISEKGHQYNIQGKDNIFIKSGNRLDLSKMPHMPVIQTIDALLSSLKFDEVILSTAEQIHLIKVWFFNTFFNFDTMQPILCAIGESGSGKSQLFKFLKGILFGWGEKRNYMLNVIPDDDHELSLMLKGKKYLFFDEVNENSPHVKKFLRTMATGIERTFRPKYERHNIEFIPDAWLAINGLNLVSSREYDIAKRLCLVQMAKLSTQDLTSQFGPEYVMYYRFNEARPLIWQNILLEIQSILKSMHKHEKDYIKLDTPCRFMGLANFAWQAWPEKRKLTHSLFSKMDRLQSAHSADMDPMMDIIEEWVGTDSRSFPDPNDDGHTTLIKTKEMFKLLQPLAKEHGVKYFPLSERALGQWFSKRETVLIESFGYERRRNSSTKTFEHRFKLPEKESF